MIVPKYIAEALNAAAGIDKCWVNSKKANEWLCDKLGLVTDDNEHTIGNWIVDFCWIRQQWFVKS